MRADPFIVARAVARAGDTVESFVYFARAGSAIKIGTTTNVGARFASMQTGNHEELVLLAVTPGDAQREHEIHRRFACDRIRGEWFCASDTLLAFVAELGGAG